MQTDDWLKTLPPPDPDGEERVWERLQASRARPAHRRWPWAVAGVLAAAAALLLTFSGGPREQVLDDVDGDRLAWSGDIQVDFQGEGMAKGTKKDLSIQWQSGVLRAEVAPKRGNQVQVVTEEATVDVVGTVFAVERGPLGTRTWVDRGRVRVACVDGSLHDVTAETGAVTCVPVRAGALLGRVDALIGLDADPDLVLDAIARGLEGADDGSAVEGELLARRVERSPELDAVLTAADAYVGRGHQLRLPDVARTASRRTADAGRCDASAQWLARLDPASLDDRLALARCWATGTEPTAHQKAAALIRSALDAGEPVPDSWRSWLVALEAP